MFPQINNKIQYQQITYLLNNKFITYLTTMASQRNQSNLQSSIKKKQNNTMASTDRFRNKSDIKKNQKDQFKNAQSEIDTQIKKVKKSTKQALTKLNPELNEQQIKKLKELSQKYLQSSTDNCQRNNCQLKIYQHKISEREKQFMTTKYSQLAALESKKKQSGLKWQIQRQVHRLRELQQKKQLQRKLEQNRKEWLRFHKIQQQRKRKQMKFTHSLNMQKFKMLRKSKKRNLKDEKQILSNLQKQSWRDMKFKQENNKRLENDRKKLEVNFFAQTKRSKSSKFHTHKKME